MFTKIPHFDGYFSSFHSLLTYSFYKIEYKQMLLRLNLIKTTGCLLMSLNP